MKLEPKIQNQSEFNTLFDINPKEKINNFFSLRFIEATPGSDGNVLIYENNTGKIATRMFWSFNEEHSILSPKIEMVSTDPIFAGRGLSQFAYKELIDRYSRLLSDKHFSQASLNNWSKKLYRTYKNRIFVISDTDFYLWNGDINKVVNTEKQFIILMNNSDIKRLNRKYN